MQRNLCAPFRKPVLNRGTNKTETQVFVDDSNVLQGTKGNRRGGIEEKDDRKEKNERVSHNEPAKRVKMKK